MTKLTREDLTGLMAKDNSMSNLGAQLDAWGIDSEAFSEVMLVWAEAATPRYADLPLHVSLSLAWGGAFLIGYAARLEIETREANAREDADLIGHTQDAADALDRIDVRDLLGPRERCAATEAGARCVYNAEHEGGHLWEDVLESGA